MSRFRPHPARVEAISEITFNWMGHLLFAAIGAGAGMVLAATFDLPVPHLAMGLIGAGAGALVMHWRMKA